MFNYVQFSAIFHLLIQNVYGTHFFLDTWYNIVCNVCHSVYSVFLSHVSVHHDNVLPFLSIYPMPVL